MRKALEMAVRPEVFAEVVIADTLQEEMGGLKLKRLEKKVKSPDWLKTVRKLEAEYTGKNGTDQVRPSLQPYVKDIKQIDLYIPYAFIREALIFQITCYFLEESAARKNYRQALKRRYNGAEIVLV